ncbi:MAG: heparinase II/III family protein [Bacteroidales bacterium]|nr:heparinase II/III family protein [Bacteroidales bacterium]
MLISIISVFAQYPAVNSGRPRIWIDSARFDTLQSQIAVPGEAQDTYDEVLYAYENWWITDPQLYLEGSDSTLWTWDWSSPYAANESKLTVFFFKMTGDTLALKRCRFIARQVISLIDTIDFSNMGWYEKESLLRQLSDNDMLLDQCYDYFPAGLRDDLTQSLYLSAREFMNTYILSSAGDSYVSSHNTWNNIFCNQNALTLYNAEGLSAQQKDTVNQWYEVIYDKLTNGFIPCWTYYRDDDGGWNWGAAYAMWSLVDQFQLFENMRIGTDKNFYTDLPWVQNSINQYVYFIRPDNKSIHLGDGQSFLAPDRVMYLHARIFNDPRSLWMAQYYSQPVFMQWTIPKFEKILYKDFTMDSVTQPELPLDWWTDKVGLSVSRSSWDSTATMVTFFNSPSKKAAHEHRDNNSFTIFKNAPLLIDAGYYDYFGNTHYRNYYTRTIAHNSICVFDSADTYLYFDDTVSNDGGQIESFHLKNYDDIFLPENQRGKWIQFASGSDYAYSIADAQLSYDTAKLDFFRRRLLYIKPEKLIVLDHVHLNNTSTHQRDISWIAHFANKPSLSGNIIYADVPGHIETYDGNICYATNGNGSIAIKTLLPDSSTVTLIGGTAYEYWVNGSNYPPDNTHDSTFYTPGKWRMEVRPKTLTDTIIYLHTIDIGDSTNTAVAGGIALQNTFSVGTDWNDTLYFFSSDADTGKTYHVFYNVAGNRTVGIFAADLIAGAYNINIDGLTYATTSTDTSGVLTSAVLLTQGNHTVEIVLTTTAMNELNGMNSLSIYPNPTNTELNILLPSSSFPYETYIYDSNAKLMMKNANRTRLDISGLPSGLYFIRLKQTGNYYSAKFIKQ